MAVTHLVAAPSVWPGHHHRLGASYDGEGTNFAVWAPDAWAVYLCLFDEHDTETRLELPEHTLGVWHGYVPGMSPGAHYGFRVEGPWDPIKGHVFNVDKLLLDPYAKAIDRTLIPHPSLGALTPKGDPNPGDSAPYTPRGVVIGDD